MANWLKNYTGMIWLIAGIIIGCIAGMLLGKNAGLLKPIGDIFLNLLFVAVIPLVFFAIASAIACIQGAHKTQSYFDHHVGSVLGTVLISALLTIATVSIFPIHQQVSLAANTVLAGTQKNLSGDQVTQLFTTGEFYQLLSRKKHARHDHFCHTGWFWYPACGRKGAGIRSIFKCR